MKTNKKDIISILLGNTLLALAVILFIVPGHLDVYKRQVCIIL